MIRKRILLLPLPSSLSLIFPLLIIVIINFETKFDYAYFDCHNNYDGS